MNNQTVIKSFELLAECPDPTVVLVENRYRKTDMISCHSWRMMQGVFILPRALTFRQYA